MTREDICSATKRLERRAGLNLSLLHEIKVGVQIWIDRLACIDFVYELEDKNKKTPKKRLWNYTGRGLWGIFALDAHLLP